MTHAPHRRQELDAPAAGQTHPSANGQRPAAALMGIKGIRGNHWPIPPGDWNDVQELYPEENEEFDE